MSSSKLQKAGPGREDVMIPWQGGCDDSRAVGHWSCSLGTPSPGHGWDMGWISSHTKTWLIGKIISFLINFVASVG